MKSNLFNLFFIFFVLFKLKATVENNNEDHLQNLLFFYESQGVFFNYEIGVLAEGNRFTIAKTDIREGDYIVLIPDEFIISEEKFYVLILS